MNPYTYLSIFISIIHSTVGFKKILLLFVICISVIACGQNKNTSNELSRGDLPTVEVLDKELLELIDPKAKLEVIGEGFGWSEGPAWVEKHQILLFSDVPNNVIYKWSEKEGVTEYLKPAGYTGEEEHSGQLGSNGLLIGQDDNLLLCQQGDRRIARMNAPLIKPEPKFTTLADNYEGRKLNSPNDLSQNSNGDIFFTDPPYGLAEGVDKELNFQGVYKISGEGKIVLLTDELSRPNGIAISPDQSTLYVANSDPDRAFWIAYKLQPDGNISSSRIFYDVTKFVDKAPGLPDGMTIDSDGYIYATGPGGIWIFSPDERLLGKINIGKPTSNCVIGNAGKMLYLTADDLLLRIPLL